MRLADIRDIGLVPLLPALPGDRVDEILDGRVLVADARVVRHLAQHLPKWLRSSGSRAICNRLYNRVPGRSSLTLFAML